MYHMDSLLDTMHDGMGPDGMMGDWWIFGPWFWMLLFWAVFIVIGVLVYKDAQKRDMNGPLWFILVILPWIGILFLIIYLLLREDKKTGTTSSSKEKSPLKILKERYAKGEITKEEYEDMKEELSE